jgi:cytochrome c biogenesis protein CcmG, thiol:disulfide interchange protein DsbE
MSEASPSAAPAGNPWRFAPIAVFLGLATVFLILLMSDRNPQDLPSALTGRPAPDFAMPALQGLDRNGAEVPGLSSVDLRGKVSVVNVFASWCGPCRDEHPQIMALSADPRIQVLGINQKDQPADALKFLGRYGNPYARVGVDRNGRVSIDWGVFGVPETFIVRADGVVAYKKVGPISPEELDAVIRPEIEKALKPS